MRGVAIILMEARTGREKQRYTAGKTRQVAGCVPVNTETRQVLLVTQRKKSGWVLPKGGWENDESQQEAAARETYEEAGAKGKVTHFLGQWDSLTINNATGCPKKMFLFFEMEVDSVEDKWPEMQERNRAWFAYEEAVKMIGEPFMREVLKQCSLAPTSNQNTTASIGC
ncbi:5377_t:CDS:2 [Paraglomus brasilianum]|uniref:5377_t:CDS:1 n=1 Tax=Paraglomus brasilianum TaxID=144538 RepID=A0A9N9BZP6_9GLOM|nr:5377_t:CDS:2 [Paraglomus brasilianum]